MLKLRTKQHIKFVTVDKGTVWIVAAVLIETRGNEPISISEPRIVKIIPKTQNLALNSSVTTIPQVLSLAAAESVVVQPIQPKVSPYFNAFGYTTSNLVPNVSARPPTQN